MAGKKATGLTAICALVGLTVAACSGSQRAAPAPREDAEPLGDGSWGQLPGSSSSAALAAHPRRAQSYDRPLDSLLQPVGGLPEGRSLIVAHGFTMYAAFGVLLPGAGLLAHVGARKGDRDTIAVHAHKLLAPLAVLIGCIGVALVFVGKVRTNKNHITAAHSIIGYTVVLSAVVVQPLVMITGHRQVHRRLGACIIAAGIGNIFQGMQLLQVDLSLQIGQVALIALILFVYTLYKPTSRNAGAAPAAPEAGPGAPQPGATTPTAPEQGAQPSSWNEEMQQRRIQKLIQESEARGTGKGDNDAEARLLKALPARIGLARIEPEPEAPKAGLLNMLRWLPGAAGPQRGTAGQLSKPELTQLIREVLSGNQVRMDENDQAALVEALMKLGDANRDGAVGFTELEALLATRGLQLTPAGTVEQTKRTSTRPEARTGKAAPPRKVGCLRRVGRRIEDNLAAHMFGAFFLLLNAAAFVLNFGLYACWFDNTGDCEPSHVAVQIAKGAGMALNLDCALIVLPMCRRLLTSLRSVRVLRRCLPLDLAYDAHVTIGWVIAAWTLVHVAGHYTNYTLNDSQATPWHDMFTSAPGVTGHVLLVILLAMCITALPVLRRARFFHIFIFTHHLFIVFFAFLVVHGYGFIGPNFWKFALVPLSLYAWERAVRISKTDGRHELQVHRCNRLAGDVTLLEFEKPANFRYLPGQYCFVALPAISGEASFPEFHPFTISSAPHESHLSLHIRSVGDWTGALHALAQPCAGRDVAAGSDGGNAAVGKVLLDGPYGSASEEIYDFDVGVMVGAGIGVTPFASILKDLRHKFDALAGAGVDMERFRKLLEVFLSSESHGRARGAGWGQTNGGRKQAAFKLQKMYFYWCTREQGSFQWFGDLLSALRSVPCGGSAGSNGQADGAAGNGNVELEIRTFITGGFQGNLGQCLLHIGLEEVQRSTGRNLLTGHNCCTVFARPDWDATFTELAAAHSGKHVGVFFCGPERLAAELRERCQSFSAGAKDGTRFSFHTEIF